jgi:hypothetical protein
MSELERGPLGALLAVAVVLNILVACFALFITFYTNLYQGHLEAWQVAATALYSGAAAVGFFQKVPFALRLVLNIVPPVIFAIVLFNV